MRLRLIGLSASVVLIGLLIASLTVKSRLETEQLYAQLIQVDSESLHIADEFRDALRQLNNSLYRYGSDHDPADLDAFRKASHQLDLWIDKQTPNLTTEQEKAVMHKIDGAYDTYLRTAKEVEASLQALGTQSATMSDFAPLMRESQDLYVLGRALREAHYALRENIFAQASRTIARVWTLQLVSLGCLFLFGVTLAIMGYRQMIVPLRAKIVEGQALLERQEKLASLGMLAAGVAHEIRNPLTAIKGAVFLQQKKFEIGSKEHADGKVVEREILRLERIVNNFLLFARPSELQLTQTTADQPLRTVYALLAPILAKKNIQLILEESAPLRIRVDEAQIEQVLINLVQNAADAIDTNGVVRLRARAQQRTLANNNTKVVVLEVADNGRGIAPEVQKRLFDPFFTTKEAGTGLGLSLAAAIVQKHGGAIEYQTQVNYGTTFGVVLPEAGP